MDKPERLFTFLATPAYRKQLDRLRKGLGLATPEGDYLKLTEAVLNHAMLGVGLKAPLRVPKGGGARPGAGRKPKVKPSP